MTLATPITEPGDAAAVIATAVMPWLREKQDVIVRPGTVAIQRGTPIGRQEDLRAVPTLTEVMIRAAIQDLSAGKDIPVGTHRTQKVWLEDQCARVVLSPHVGVFGGAGPEIYYRWLPSS